MKVSIIGAGYVGLVSGACFAEVGHEVTCVDVDRERVDRIRRGQAPIYEDGLDELLRRHAGKRLSATTDLRAAVENSEVTFIAVGTPFGGEQIDLGFVRQAADEIGAALAKKQDYHVVVVKSTVVPGTTDEVVRPHLEKASAKRAGIDFGVGMNPEFLTEGTAVRDFMEPDRIVLGGMDQRTIEVLAKLYAPFAGVATVRTNNKTAEMIKYTSNALLATLISFSNEMANLGSALGDIDTVEVMRGLHLSQYFRGRTDEGLPPITSFLKAGCGFGGSCLPKDVKALIAHGRKAGVPMRLLQSVIDVNQDQPGKTVELLRRHWTDLRGVRVAILGLSFKPDTNDVRESPAFPVMRELLREGADLSAFDPVANHEAKQAFGTNGVRYCENLDAALADAEAVVVVTPWKEFRTVPELLRDRQPAVVLVDSRRVFDKGSVARYEGIGL